MNTVKQKRLKTAKVDTNLCVACGCCVKVCPKNAIKIFKGIYAQAEKETCAGCGKCKAACPASVIEMEAAV